MSEIENGPIEQGLTRYNAACKAIAAALHTDEILQIADQADQLRAAAIVANNRELEEQAIEIRERAERRLGQLMKLQKETVGMNPGVRAKGGGIDPGGFMQNPPENIPTLDDVGIDKNLAHRARKAAAIPEEQFEKTVKSKAKAEVGRRISGKRKPGPKPGYHKKKTLASDKVPSSMPLMMKEMLKREHAVIRLAAAPQPVSPTDINNILGSANPSYEQVRCWTHICWLKFSKDSDGRFVLQVNHHHREACEKMRAFPGHSTLADALLWTRDESIRRMKITEGNPKWLTREGSAINHRHSVDWIRDRLKEIIEQLPGFYVTRQKLEKLVELIAAQKKDSHILSERYISEEKSLFLLLCHVQGELTLLAQTINPLVLGDVQEAIQTNENGALNAPQEKINVN